MIGSTAMHTPEGIQDLNGQVLQILTDRLGDKSWTLVASDDDPDMPRTTSTLGANRFDQPDILLGFTLTNEGAELLEPLINDLYAWFEQNNAIDIGKLDMHAFWDFRKAKHGSEWTGSDTPNLSDNIYLELVDEDRFLTGIGWHHRAYYAANEIDNLCFLQMFIADTLGRFPGEKGYSSIQQYRHEVKPWGEAEKITDKRPDFDNRLKYLH